MICKLHWACLPRGSDNVVLGRQADLPETSTFRYVQPGLKSLARIDALDNCNPTTGKFVFRDVPDSN